MKISDFITIAKPVLDKVQKSVVDPFRRKNVLQEGHRPVVGLDIGKTHIDVIQVTQNNGVATIEKYAHHKILPDTPISAQLKHVLTAAGISEKKVRVSVKGQGVILRFVSFPRMAKNEFQSALQYEAEKYLPFAISEVVLDFHIIETPSASSESMKTMDVILVAVRTQEVMRIVKLLQESGLQAASVGVDAIACTNAFLATHSEDVKVETFVLADFGTKDTNLNIIDRGELRFSRDIAFGRTDVAQFLKRKFQLSDDEIALIHDQNQASKPEHKDMLRQSYGFLVQEIKTSLNYFYGQRPETARPKTIFVSGGLAMSDLLREAITAQVEVPVLQWNPTEKLSISVEINKEDLTNFQHYLPVCLGLSVV